MTSRSDDSQLPGSPALSVLLRVLLACGLVTLLSASGDAQRGPSSARFRSERITLAAAPGSSSVVYRLDVVLPPEYESSAAGLPVLYYLDAWWWGDLMPSLARLSALAAPPRTAPVILVGIAVEGDADDWNRARTRDFTPSPYRPIAPGVTMRTGNVMLDAAGTGGAQAFLRVLEQDVIPTVERRYRTQPAARGIAGHSYGGLFAVYAMTQRPGLFSRHLLVSPATYWNDNEVLAPGLFRADTAAVDHRVFVAVGGRELPIMHRSVADLVAVLERQRGVVLRERTYPDADHLSVLPAALLDGLEFLYGR